MDKIKRLINFVLPVKACNFRCAYCYIRQVNPPMSDIGEMQYSLDHIQKALTMERLGGICHMNMCGQGETLIPSYAVDLAVRMLENGHYVSIVTNGTITNRIEELCSIASELKRRLFFKFSFHYHELIRLGLMDVFFSNVKLVKRSGCAFTVELTVNDETIPDIEEIKTLCQEELGAACHVIESRNNLDGFSRLTELDVDKHQAAWGEFQSPLFNFQQEHWMVKREEFCYAGDWVVSLNAGSGWMCPCFAGGNAIENIYENIDEPIHFCAIGQKCQWTHCYAAYALLSSGVIPELDTPDYASFRDRNCCDGTTWLTPSVRAFFQGKLKDTNVPYSEDKKKYINALMAHIYEGTNTADMEALSNILARRLHARGIKTVAIWGRNGHTDWLLPLFEKSDLRVKYWVDTRYQEEVPVKRKAKLKHIVKYPLKRLLRREGHTVLLNRFDSLPRVDAVIVTDYVQFGSIKKEIPNVTDNILSLTELADECCQPNAEISKRGK